VNGSPPGSAPSATLPLAYLLTAAVAFVAGALALPWLAAELAGHYYHPRLFALTHTFTLGWITLTIFGASYQLVPIVLGRPLWSERLARRQLAVLVVGVAGMIGHFALGEWRGLAWSAALVALGTAAHLGNVALSLRGLRQWTFTARLVTMAHVGLALTVVLGVLIAVDHVIRVLPDDVLARLHAHVHLALLGWVLPMVIGVAARAYPMFLLAREPAGRLRHVQLWGVAAGVPATVLGLLLGIHVVVALGALAVAAAVGAHLTWVSAMVRQRRRPGLDWGLRFVLAGATALVPATLIGLALALDVAAGPRWSLVYAVLAFGGWASLTIVGMMLKIVPFLVWYRAYAPRAGRAPVPALPQLSWRRAEAAAWALLSGGVAALAIGVGVGDVVTIRVAGTSVAAGAVVFVAALARTLAHLRQRHAPAAGVVVVRAS
jgi:hypothetical protein